MDIYIITWFPEKKYSYKLSIFITHEKIKDKSLIRSNIQFILRLTHLAPKFLLLLFCCYQNWPQLAFGYYLSSVTFAYNILYTFFLIFMTLTFLSADQLLIEYHTS